MEGWRKQWLAEWWAPWKRRSHRSISGGINVRLADVAASITGITMRTAAWNSSSRIGCIEGISKLKDAFHMSVWLHDYPVRFQGSAGNMELGGCCGKPTYQWIRWRPLLGAIQPFRGRIFRQRHPDAPRGISAGMLQSSFTEVKRYERKRVLCKKYNYFGDPSNPKIVVLHRASGREKVCCLCWSELRNSHL